MSFERLTGGPDPAHVREEMLALKEPERRKRAKAAEHEFHTYAWRGSGERASKRWRAAAFAWVGTTTARKLVTDFWRISEMQDDPQLADDVYAVLSARGRAFFDTVARGLLRSEGGWGSWPLVRRGVREGLIDPPEGDDYIRLLVSGVSGRSANELDSTYRGLLADHQLLEREVWQLFEIDAGSELSNANAWWQKEEGKPSEGYVRGDNRWVYALTRLADEQRLDRQRLLDASLDALMRDFRATTVGWYATLHEELEPTRAERLERLDRYLALVTSPAPAVVKEGLAALRELEDAVPPDAFARVAPTPFTQRQKNLSIETLSLLTRLCKSHPGARSVLLGAAAHALAHERADVQERALKLLEQYVGDAPRAALLAYVEVVSATLRPRVEALTGVASTQEEAREIVVQAPVQPQPTPELMRGVWAELAPVESIDELIELAAMLVEGQGNGDDCERFLDGVSRLCDRRPRDLERRTAGLAKRVAGLDFRGWGPPPSGTELVMYVTQAWIARRRPKARFSKSPTMIGFLAGRAEEVAKRAIRSVARPLLALPTHSGGWIDPGVLEERERATGRIFNRPDSLDRLQAAVRAFPDLGRLAYAREVSTTTEWGRTYRGLRLHCPAVPAGLGELAVPAAETGKVRETPYSLESWGGLDVLGVRWSLTVLPSLPEVAFAGAATTAVQAREGSSSEHPGAVLEHALDRYVPLGPEAWLAISACLVAKSPDLPRVAVDLLVASIEDGRFDAAGLGEQLAWLIGYDFAKVNRLEAPLRDVARVSPLHAAQVVRAVEAVLARLDFSPRGLHALLAVAVEGATSTRRRVEDERARSALERIAGDVSPSSKLGKLARSLLDRE